MPGFPTCKVGSHTAHTPTCRGDGLVLTALTVRITWSPTVCQGKRLGGAGCLPESPTYCAGGHCRSPQAKRNLLQCTHWEAERSKERGRWDMPRASGTP